MTMQEAFTTPQMAKLTVEDFVLLAQSGAFETYAKTELIDGKIFVVNAQFAEHMKAKVRLLRRLADACDALDRGLEAWSEGSVDMQPASMPEPDVFITSETPATGAVPKNTVVLVAEIADTSRDFDLGEKARLYAANGIGEYWVLDLQSRLVHQQWSPVDAVYREQRTVPFGQPVEAITIAGLKVDSRDL